MNQEATQKSKDVQSHSEVVEALLKGEIERLKDDLAEHFVLKSK